jgi:hydrogenase-4 component F
LSALADWPVVFALPALVILAGLTPRAARVLPQAAAALMLAQLLVVFNVCRPAFARAEGSVGDLGIGGLTAAFLIITTIVAAASFVQAAALLPAERADAPEQGITDRRLCFFYTLAGSFLAAMYAVLLSHNLGFMWISMEATTLLSAPLVYYHRTQRSLEAAWKYLLLCSVGIAFALFGTVLLVAAQHASGEGASLLFGRLIANGSALDPRLVRLGFVFCVLGYGAKAGLFPLHNWLPDAHSEAPAPASAMLSGGLLNCALVAIWRVAQVTQAAGQGHLVRQILVPAGAITVLAASLMLLRQSDLKRMWAYSSVEHVGLLALAIGVGSTPVFILHALNHSLVKVALFLLSGSIIHVYGTKSLPKLRGLLNVAPAWGIALFAGAFAIAGSPPFGTFLSEWLLLRDTFAAGEAVAGGAVILGLTVAFVAISIHASRVLFGAAPPSVLRRPREAWVAAPAALLLAGLVTGLALTPPAMRFLTMLALGGQP